MHREEDGRRGTVISERYQELLSGLLDGELPDAAAQELADGVKGRPELLQDLRRHLALWEAWSQHQAPERSADAFLAAWKTRLRAESEATGTFQQALRNRLGPQDGVPAIATHADSAVRAPNRPREIRSLAARALAAWTAVRRPAGLAWAASLLVVGLALVFWFGSARPAQAVTSLEGEAVCTSCVLHESHEHRPAIRVTGPNAPGIYYLDLNEAVAGLQQRFCSGPTPAVATGKPRTERGRLLFEASKLVLPEPPPAPKPERILFPI
jgi:hypothetical protein